MHLIGTFTAIAFAATALLKPAAAAGNKTVRFKADHDSVLRNPATGWALYAADLHLPDANAYWKEVEAFVPAASIVYIRLPWSLYETEEGAYGWEQPGNLKTLIDGAKQRGLKLAFRVVLNSKDCKQSAAPAYVRAAGAKGYDEKGEGGVPLWSPDARDPVFRAKFGKFLDAFAMAFDDPAAVDFIDAVGLGYWGEMHHLGFPREDRPEVYEWICSSYAARFKRVLLGTQVVSDLGNSGPLDRSIAIGRHGYVARLDSLGSHWMWHEKLPSTIGDAPFFGESCYFSLREWDMWKDPKEKFENPRQVLEATMKDAFRYKANTLDLRKPNDCRTWFELAPDLVRRFVSEGGYRIFPEEISYPEKAEGQTLTIKHTWRNLGIGFLPNGNRRWNGKYRVAFALFRTGGTPPFAVHVDQNIDPGEWKGKSRHECSTTIPFPTPSGTYQLAVSIVDTTRGNEPGIHLATHDAKLVSGWTVIGKVAAGK
ncbi:MAG: hypothetical protein KF712_14645 [Akkermansiaceae bacterium]|nr:hypothetical protein [Akkermansiaceae bacterium]